MKKRRIIIGLICVFVVLLFAAGTYLFVSGRQVINTSYTFVSEKVPKQFDGFKIALITDFHNCGNYAEVAEKVRNASPDIICIAGDLVSMDTTDYSNTKELISRLMKIAQVYYTYGNHEYYNATYHNCDEPPIRQELDGSGVIFLNNSIRTIKRNGALINLIGYGDSIHADGDKNDAFWQHAEPFISEIGQSIDKKVLSVLLLHRAQYFDEVSKYPFDLVLGGHMHGGQVGIKPIQSRILKKHVSTDKYSKGEYFENGHELIISAGCTSDDGFRLFNPPEVVSIVLKRAKQ